MAWGTQSPNTEKTQKKKCSQHKRNLIWRLGDSTCAFFSPKPCMRSRPKLVLTNQNARNDSSPPSLGQLIAALLSCSDAPWSLLIKQKWKPALRTFFAGLLFWLIQNAVYIREGIYHFYIATQYGLISTINLLS